MDNIEKNTSKKEKSREGFSVKSKPTFLVLVKNKLSKPVENLYKYFARYWDRKISEKILNFKVWVGLSRFVSKKSKKASVVVLGLAPNSFSRFAIRTEGKIIKFFGGVIQKLNNKAEKHNFIIEKRKFSLSYSPFLALQGVAVFGLTLCLLFLGLNLINPKNSKTFNKEVLQTAQIYPAGPIIAGQSVKWVAVVNKQDITNNKYFLKLPKQASNIKVKTLSYTDTTKYLASIQDSKQNPLTDQKRMQLAGISSLKNPLFADLEEITGNVVAAITNTASDVATAVVGTIQEVTGQVQQTEDAKLVDLSSEAPVEPVIQKEEKKQAKEEIKDDKKENKKEEKSTVQELAPESILTEQKPTSATQPVAPATQSDSSTSTTPETSPEVEPSTDTTEIIADTDQVLVEFETPGAQITEEDTNNGKLVTVSSSDAEKIDCEALNPNSAPNTLGVSEVLSNAGASLLDGFTGAIKSITKLLAADLEQAVSQLTETITGSDEPPSSPEVTEEQGELVVEVSVGESSLIETPEETSELVETPIEEVVTPEVPEAAEETPIISAEETAYQNCLAQKTPLTDVLAFTNIPEIYNVGQEDKIKIKWKSNNNQDVAFHAYDLNNNGKLDYVEWTVPHLSEQIFEIIFISKAFELDENKEIVADIYDTVKTQDNTWATVTDGHYIRATFEQILDNTKDNTIYAKPNKLNQPGTIEVYPVYTDADGSQTQGPLAATFSAIDHEDTYKVLLTNLQTSTDVFDLKVVGGSIDFDYIVDPALTSGPNGPGTASTSNASGGTADWYAPNYALDDGSYATPSVVGDTREVVCLSPDTLISTEGDDKRIKDLKEEELVYSYNFISGKIELKKASNIFKVAVSALNNKYYHIYYENGDVKATFDHLFYTDEGFIIAKDLKIGDNLLDINGVEQQITNIIVEENEDEYVWNLSVDDNQNFFANGILVHNSGVYDDKVRIIKGGVVGSTDRASGSAWPGTLTYSTYGSSSDLWGETWTVADINSSSFGVAISAKGVGYASGNYTSYYLKLTNFGFNIPAGSTINGINVEIKKYTNMTYPSVTFVDAWVDYARITIYYTAPPANAYWVGGDGNWSDAANHWATSSGGVAGAGNLPGTTTNVYFDSSSGTGTVTLDGNISVADFDLTSANITVNVGAGKTITASGTLTMSNGLVTGANNNVAITANVVNMSGGSITTTTSGNITLNSSGTPGAFDLQTITSLGTITIGNTTAPATLSLGTISSAGAQAYTATTSTTLNSTIHKTAGGTAGAIAFTGPVLLATGAIEVHNLATSDDDDVTFSSTINGAQALSLTTTTAGDIEILGSVGNITPLTGFSSRGDNLRIKDFTTTGNQTYGVRGDIILEGNLHLNVAGAINFNQSASIITLGADVEIHNLGATNTDDITISSGTINGQWALALTTTTLGDIVVSSAVGGSAPLSSLTASGDTISVKAVTTNGSQSYTSTTSTTLNGAIHQNAQTGAITFTGPVLLATGAIEIHNLGTSDTDDITFSATSTINGARALTLTTTTLGDIVFSSGAVVGGSSMLTSLTVNGDSVNIYAVTTAGAQSYTGTTTLDGALDVGGDFTIGGGTLSAGSSAINVAGNWNNSGTFSAGTGTVTLDGISQKVFGTTTFYNLTKDISAGSADQIMFENSKTQSIAANGALTLKGASGKVLTIRSCDSSGAQTDGSAWNLNVNNTGTTVVADYVDVMDSDASAGKAIVQTNSTDSGDNPNWVFNLSPNDPVLVSPIDATDTNDSTPTLSVSYSDPDTLDTGKTYYRISSSSLPDCVANTNVVAWGNSDETADENEDTTWTPDSSIGDDATYYWCAQNNDGTLTSDWTQMGTFTLDTIIPTLAEVTRVPNLTGSHTPSYTFSSSEAGTITYGGDCSSATTQALSGNNDITFSELSSGNHTNCTITVTDAGGNPSSALSVSAFAVASSGGGNYIGANSSPSPSPISELSTTTTTTVPTKIMNSVSNAVEGISNALSQLLKNLSFIKPTTNSPFNPPSDQASSTDSDIATTTTNNQGIIMQVIQNVLTTIKNLLNLFSS